MPAHSFESPRKLPDRPNLRYLKEQAKGLLKAGEAASLTEAQLKIARSYGFASWPKLKEHVESRGRTEDVNWLKQAIDENNLDEVKRLMTRNPELHRAPLGYNQNGPLTWVSECRVPWEPPSAVRLTMAQWMIDNGSDVHQGGDGPLMRAALVDHRIPMMELLVRNGADVNAQWDERFPIIFAPCETVAPRALKWLIDRGAKPFSDSWKKRETALDYVIGTYSRSAELGQCIDILLGAGCPTTRNVPPVLEILRGRIDRLRELLDADPLLVQQRFPQLDFGSTGYRRLTLRGGTLLHVAAEYGNMDAARLLMDRGADVNAPAEIDADGVGGQTPIFHAASQFYDFGFAIVELLVECKAELSIRAKLPGHYERESEFVECTPLEYTKLFPGQENRTISFLTAAAQY